MNKTKKTLMLNHKALVDAEKELSAVVQRWKMWERLNQGKWSLQSKQKELAKHNLQVSKLNIKVGQLRNSLKEGA